MNTPVVNEIIADISKAIAHIKRMENTPELRKAFDRRVKQLDEKREIDTDLAYLLLECDWWFCRNS